MRTDGVTLVAALVLVVVVVAAAFAPAVAEHDPYARSLPDRLLPPAWAQGGSVGHVLGTDGLGRDVLSRLIYGARISLAVGLVVPVIATVVGSALGLIAGYWGGTVDQVIMVVVEVGLTFPFLLLALALMGVMGVGLQNTIIVLGLTAWPAYARVTRSETLALREREFVSAARAVGGSELRVAVRHVLPNLVPSLIVLASLQIATAIIAESSLSFLGMGVPSPTPSWGTMLAEGRPYIDSAWWLALFPGLAILATTLCVNLLGDRLRDSLDPTVGD